MVNKMKKEQLVTQKVREKILNIAKLHGIVKVRLFGSLVRGEATEASDIDFLVDMEDGRSLLELIGFKQDIEELLNCKVDVLSSGGVSPYLKERIFSEAVPL